MGCCLDKTVRPQRETARQQQNENSINTNNFDLATQIDGARQESAWQRATNHGATDDTTHGLTLTAVSSSSGAEANVSGRTLKTNNSANSTTAESSGSGNDQQFQLAIVEPCADDNEKINVICSSKNNSKLLLPHELFPGKVPGSISSNSVLSKEDPNLCPICFEIKPDVEVLEHWDMGGSGASRVGDISGHRMCGDCLQKWGNDGQKDFCPFCKELLLKDEVIGFIREMVDTVKSKSATGDPNMMASVIERWQLFEMQHENPRVLHRVCNLVVEDEKFQAMLDDAVKGKKVWLRDTAGIIFRLHGMVTDGHIRSDTSVGRNLIAAIEVILTPFEQGPPPELHAHYYGALYMQAIVPWLCAWRSGDTTDGLKQLVKRTGRALVSCYQKITGDASRKAQWRRQFRERCHMQYLDLTYIEVWGSQREDPVWRDLISKR